MTTIDVGMSRLRTAAGRVYDHWERADRWVKGLLPKGLYARARSSSSSHRW